MAASGGRDDERTVLARRPLHRVPPKKRRPWVWVGLGGCAGLLCLALVGAAAFFLAGGDGGFEIGLGGGTETSTLEIISLPSPTKLEAATTVEPSPEPTPTAATAEPTATKGTSGGVLPPTATPNATETAGPTPTKATSGGVQPPTATPKATETLTAAPTSASEEPKIGPITFAVGVTEEKEPVGAETTFPDDIDEIHAIFGYDGMTDDDAWERFWYQDGEEVGSGSDPWESGVSGTFDLSLTGGGEPLGAGSWKLEIYVNGELAQTGTFVIQASATPTSAPVAKTYKIAFARWDGSKHNLYVADTDGTVEQFLLESAAGPSWSPDGQFLSIFGEQGIATQVRDGVPYHRKDLTDGILILKVAGFPTDITQVDLEQLVRDGTARWTAWSPNGDMLAFDATRGSPDRRIYFLGTSDNQQFNYEIPGEQADWSPDSSQVVYRSGRDGIQGIWVSNRDDSGANNITNGGSDSLPRWSPDGQEIAFHRDSGDNVDIYVMNADGSNVRRLTDAPGPDTLPAWTPDGRIMFRSARTGGWSIYIMRADGRDQQAVIANAHPGPDWSFGRMDVY